MRFTLELVVPQEAPPGKEVVLTAVPYAAMGHATAAPLKKRDEGWEARMVEPARPASGAQSANRFRGWILGVCPCTKQAQAELLACDKVQELVRLTRAAALRVGRGARRQVQPQDVEECESLLTSVVLLQALAGRGKKKSERKKWAGRPVSELVRYIYDDHVNRLLRARERRERHFDPGVDPDTGQRHEDD